MEQSQASNGSPKQAPKQVPKVLRLEVKAPKHVLDFLAEKNLELHGINLKNGSVSVYHKPTQCLNPAIQYFETVKVEVIS